MYGQLSGIVLPLSCASVYIQNTASDQQYGHYEHDLVWFESHNHFRPSLADPLKVNGVKPLDFV